MKGLHCHMGPRDFSGSVLLTRAMSGSKVSVDVRVLWFPKDHLGGPRSGLLLKAVLMSIGCTELVPPLAGPRKAGSTSQWLQEHTV